MCVVYLNYMYYVKAAEEMLSMWYFGTLYVAIYSLNLDLANKCVPLKIVLLRLQYISMLQHMSEIVL